MAFIAQKGSAGFYTLYTEFFHQVAIQIQSVTLQAPTVQLANERPAESINQGAILF